MAEIWIADDDNAIRYVLGEALREGGAQVREFSDAEQLLQALGAATPDVVERRTHARYRRP